MLFKKLSQIAVLEAELLMTEAHARKLSALVESASSSEDNEIRALLEEENDRAEVLRRKISLLKTHEPTHL